MKAVLITLIFAGAAAAQDLYVYSNLQTGGSGNATATASSSTDYSTAYYYDLQVAEWLSFQPDNGSGYQVCTQEAAIENYSYTSVSCSGNVGAGGGYFTLESYHDLNTVYYYYQLQSCSWQCSYWDDYYGYSLISNPDYTDNAYVYATDQATPTSQSTAINAQIDRQVRQGGCVYPTSETTYGWGWDSGYWPYLGQFLQVLNGGSFANQYLTEQFSSPATDTCWQQGNSTSPATNPSPVGTWAVSFIKFEDANLNADYAFSYSNGWGYDNVGFVGTTGNTMVYNDVNNMRPSNGTCSITFTQNMYMYCSGVSGPGQYYVTSNPLAIYISATPSAASLTSSRSAVQIQRSYP
jgi:hypothetical protein